MKSAITYISLIALIIGAHCSKAQQSKVTPSGTEIKKKIKQEQLKPAERQYAVKLSTETEAGVYDATKGLSTAQLNFKPAPDKWSADECVKHIAASESNLWLMVDDLLKQPTNPDKRSGIKVTDEQFVKAVEDRSHKSKTFAALEPANSPYQTTDEALAAFKQNRAKLIDFIKSTHLDLRNHVAELPIGTYDAYQLILLIAAHTNRHTQQIEEIKADANFPKD
jgi:hypothetical protein